jgi:archaellum component FlaC
MPKLSRSRVAQIVGTLDETFFTSAGFNILEALSNEFRIVEIRFRDKRQYFIALDYTYVTEHEEQIDKKTLFVDYSPGDFFESGGKRVGSFSDFLDEIEAWAGRVENEYTIVGIFQQKISDFKEQLEEKIESHVQDGDAHFSFQEREYIYTTLEQLRDRLIDLEKDSELSTATIEEIRETVENLEKASHNMTKKGWLRTACSKLYALSIRTLASAPGQKLLEGAVDKLLQ